GGGNRDWYIAQELPNLEEIGAGAEDKLEGIVLELFDWEPEEIFGGVSGRVMVEEEEKLGFLEWARFYI
ncbi:hypothetical protein Csa_010066, partial [Cucumis sativus]